MIRNGLNNIPRHLIGQTVYAVIKGRPVKYIKRIPTGNPKRPWRYFYSDDEWKAYEKKQKLIQTAVMEARENPHEPETIGDLTVDMHGNAVVVRGETKKHVDLLRKIREQIGVGGWNDALKAWVFPRKRRIDVIRMLKDGLSNTDDIADRKIRQEIIHTAIETARNSAEDERKEEQARVSIRQQQKINEQIKELLRSKRPEEMTDDDKKLLARYEGQGGQATNAENDYVGKGLLYEYYTPESVIQKTWKILQGYLPEGARILEPSAGTGRWYNPRYKFDMREIDPTAAAIASILRPDANISVGAFEEMFLDERRRSKKTYDGPMYDAVVGNPPYGEMTGEYKATEGRGWRRYENYFLSRSLDTVQEGGIVAMIVPSSFLRSGMTPDKKKIFAKAELVDAYRLPNGAFSHTDIGTDLVILRKNTTEFKDLSSAVNNAFFEQHPEKVFGEEVNRKSRYGMERYVKGSLDAFMSAPVGPPKQLSEEHRRAISEGLIGNQNAVGARRTAKNKSAVKASRTKAAIKTTVKTAKNGAPPHVLFTQETFARTYGVQASEADLVILRNTSATGTIDKSIPFDPERMAIHNGEHVPLYLYTAGNIIDKLADLEREKETLPAGQYERQKALLESVKKPTIPLNDIALTPLDPFARGYVLDNGAHLLDVFKSWISELDYSVLSRLKLMRTDILDYVDGVPVRGQDKDDNARRRRERKIIGNQLFRQFLSEALAPEEQDRLVEQWNYAFNAHVDVEFGKVPIMADGLNTRFKGKEYEIRKPQLDFIGKFMATGIGCAVHEVGLGKTMTGSIATVNNMLAGRCKKPLIIVPSSILTKWSRDFSALYPEIKTNVIGTPELNAMSAADGKLKIEDGSVTIMSYDAFTALSFSPERFSELTNDLADQFINPYEKPQSKRERAKEQEKKDELKGRVAKGSSKILFDEAGFDHLTVDEAHNFNNIFTDVNRKAMPDDMQANEFTGILGAGSSSDRGMKLWVAARHILKSNQNRNVLLLTATPFTNNPLQVYSLLSLMGKARLEGMGIYNVRDFLATFIETQTENVMEANGKVTQKQTMRRWKNGHALTALINEFFDRKSGAETGIERPELVEKTVILPMTSEQEDIRDRLEELYDMRQFEGAALKSMGLQQLMNISPALIKDRHYNERGGEGFVERSPKLKFVVESVAQLYRGLNESNIKKMPGQIIFLPRGVEFYEELKKELVNRGIPEDAIQFMRPEEKSKKALDPEKRKQGISRFVEIADDFNNPDGKTKIIIGTDTIQEGISLQKNSAVAYNCMMDWNPTNTEQKKGRLWRYGNRQKRVHVFYPLIENSIDTKLAQKHAEKVSRINDLFKSTGSPFIDTAEINPDEIKLDVIRDPKRKARLKIEQEKADLRVKEQELIALAGMKKAIAESYQEAKSQIELETREVNKYTELVNEALAKQRQDYANVYKEDLKRHRRWLASAQAKVRDIEAKYAKQGTTPEDDMREVQRLISQADEIKKQIYEIEQRHGEYTEKFAAELAAQIEKTRPLDEIIRDHVAELMNSVLASQPQNEEK